jgi:hypothetical protein
VATTLSIRAQLAGNYAALVLADGPVGYWRLGESEGYAQAVLSDGPFGFWRLGDASGTVATDSSGNGRNGTYNAGTTLNADGALSDGSKATDFSGAPAANVTNTNTLAAITGACSLEGWFNADTVAAGLFHVIWISSSGDSYIAINTVGGITSAFSLGGLSRSIASSAALVSTGAWYHIVATWDADKIRLYVNGALVNTSASFVGALSLGAGTFRIGTNNGGGEALDGRIDEVAVYNYTLSMQQIANHYALRTSTIATVAAATVADSSGNGRTATIAGGVTLQQPTPQPDLNTAALFDGVASYASVPTYDAAAGRTAISLEGWVNHNGAAWNAVQAEIFLSLGSTGHYISVNSFGALCSLRISGTQNLLQSAATVPTTGWHHIVMTWTSGDVMRIYLDGVLSNTSAVFSGTLDSAPGITLGAFSSGAGFRLAGAADELAVYPYALTAAQVLNHYVSGSWTDLTSDLTTAPIRITRGFQSTAPDDLVAAPASLQFGLDNSVHNAGATRSYYSPDSTSKRTGWQTGIRVQCRVTANGTTRTRFDGWLDVTTPQAGLFEDQTVACLAIGWLGHAATALATGLPAQIAKRADQLIAALVAVVPFQPPATSIATGLDTFPVAFDDLDPTTSTVNDALDSVVKSGFDRLYEKADGTLVYETRATREMPAPNVLTLTDLSSSPTPGLALTAVPAERRRDAIRNRFQVTVHPRRLDAAAVILYALQISGATAAIPPGATVTFGGAFVDPTQASQQVGGFNTLISDGAGGSVIGTSGSLPTGDYAFGSSAGGTDLSAACPVTVAYEIGQVTFTVTNTAAVPAIPSKLQCRGQGIYNYQTVTATEADTSSQGVVGQSTVTVNCPYQADPYFAQAAALYGLNLYGPSRTFLDQGVQAFVHAGDEVSMDTLLQREISDAIAITETLTGLNAGNYWINAGVEEYDERTNATFTLMLTPRDVTTYFTVDVSTLDGPDVLAAI